MNKEKYNQIKKIFEENKGYARTQDIIDDKTRLRRWEGYLKRIGKDVIEIPRVMERTNIFLNAIYTSIIKEKEFFKTWNHQKNYWE